MSRLPTVLDARDLPLPELYAARLDGELFAIDACFSPIDQPESAAHRGRAIALQSPERLIAERGTAAWIWGARDSPPTRHELCASLGARARASGPLRFTVREVMIDQDEIEIAGTMRVTTPLRTVIDIARFSEDFGPADSQAVAALLRIGLVSPAHCIAALNRRTNLPNKKLALERLRTIWVPGSGDSEQF